MTDPHLKLDRRRSSTPVSGTAVGSGRNTPSHRAVVSLQREPEPVVLAAAAVDQLQVGVIEEEHAIELLPRRAAVIAAVRGRLRIG